MADQPTPSRDRGPQREATRGGDVPPQIDPATGDRPGELRGRYRAGTEHVEVDPAGASGVHTPQAATVRPVEEADGFPTSRPAASPQGMQRPVADEADDADAPAARRRKAKSGTRR